MDIIYRKLSSILFPEIEIALYNIGDSYSSPVFKEIRNGKIYFPSVFFYEPIEGGG